MHQMGRRGNVQHLGARGASGSTGRPRGVVRSLASWQLSLDPLSELTGIGPGDVVWVPGPLTSSLYLYGAFHARTVGAVVVAHPSRAVTAAHLVPSGDPAPPANGGRGR